MQNSSVDSAEPSRDNGENKKAIDNTVLEKEKTKNSVARDTPGPPYTIFGPWTKAWIIFLVSLSALISPFAATTYYPALNVLSDVLHISPTMVNISITTYMVKLPRLFLTVRLHAKLRGIDRSSYCSFDNWRHVRQRWSSTVLHRILLHLHHIEHWPRTTDELRCSANLTNGASIWLQCIHRAICRCRR